MAYIYDKDKVEFQTADYKNDRDSNNLVNAKFLGEDDATYEKRNTEFAKSDDVNSWDAKTNDSYSNFSQEASNKNIISQDVKNNLNKQFSVSSAISQADAYLSSQLQKIQSGKTSYSDDVQNMMDKILNREKFTYDVDTDPLFQQALASAMNSGKQAMQDTIGQASALTGGYGSTYATSAGNQAYNSFIEDAYDNIAEYYQMAWNQYQAEGDEMYRQLGMFTDADDREYNRNVTAYDATYQHRNRMYDEQYNMYRDDKNDAFAMANLQITEHGQKVSDAYNLYNATSNQADKLYEREYNSWLDSVNMAYKNAEMLNSDYWNQSNQIFQATENQKNRDFQASEAEKERAFTASENAKNRAVKSSSSNPSGSALDLSPSEINAVVKAYNDAGGGDKGKQAALGALQLLGKPVQSAEQVDALDSILAGNTVVSDSESGIDWTKATITKTEDTVNGLFGLGGNWHIDSNDKYTVNGKSYYADDIKSAMEEDGLPDATIDKILKEINKLGKGGTYTYGK